MKYVDQLDGFRAVSVLMVVVWHFSPRWIKDSWAANFEFARMGVLSFFVLSGFLITSILLGYRERVARHELGLWSALRLFIVRRTLRIFPLYYGVLIVFGLILEVPSVRQNMAWHLTYTANFGMAFGGKSFGIANHFWSLCVEEQFYLVWPFIVLLIARPEKLVRIITAVLAASLGAGFCWYAFTGPGIFGDAVTIGGPSYALVAGALLAAHFQSDNKITTMFRLDRPLFVLAAGALLFVLVTLIAHEISGKLELFLRDMSWPLICVWIIYQAAHGRIHALAWQPLRWIGKISYGIYVYHLLLSIYFPQLFNRLGLNESDNELIGLIVKIMFVILVAAISYYAFEGPILRLRDRFTSQPHSSAGRVPA